MLIKDTNSIFFNYYHFSNVSPCKKLTITPSDMFSGYFRLLWNQNLETRHASAPKLHASRLLRSDEVLGTLTPIHNRAIELLINQGIIFQMVTYSKYYAEFKTQKNHIVLSFLTIYEL